jgi:hypothetical protein
MPLVVMQISPALQQAPLQSGVAHPPLSIPEPVSFAASLVVPESTDPVSGLVSPESTAEESPEPESPPPEV